jgi:mono/diheme cytochrome c family protein
MKRFLIFFGSLLLVAALALALIPNSSANALPEYASQTGEPCATCHISPSGGGPRGPRGQAWVASSKPGAVPDLIQSLELLGVKLTVDPAYFTVTDLEVQEPEALETTFGQGQPLYRWLSEYDGN